MKNYRRGENERIPLCVAVSSKTGIPVDTLGGYPQITVKYGRQITVEGNCTILEYTGELLKIKCKNVIIKVSGRNICVKLMDELSLVANGNISCICFEE